ncbi:hypothetical protein [Cellulosimicrobium funkei]|uniref:hypothetical protein n=1 Tax=Cellulosimicrobium funkei TaxID=264251 RepID=UPI0036A6C75B
MADRFLTPVELARELEVSASVVRRWLRANAIRGTAGWQIDQQSAAAARSHFATTAARRRAEGQTCTVDGCPRAAVGRRLCRMHYNRWHRTGSTDGHDRGAHQKAKTHCPNGHPYNEQNTVVYADGRRRCRTCRRAYGSKTS